MKNQLFIPDKIKVGFQRRRDTYTGNLAYIIYYDKNGVLRKEASWEQWRDKKIEPLEFDNTPMEGFVLNKNGGGKYSWNARNEFIRVYDPRDFEFEISVANLLFILRECDCSRGKGLEGKMVYAWDGTSLVLLPAHSQEYIASTGFSELQGKKISAKDLIKGATYQTKKDGQMIYLGRFMCYNEHVSSEYYARRYKNTKRHVFVVNKQEAKYNYETREIEPTGKIIPQLHFDSTNKLAVCLDESPVENYAELVDWFYKGANGSRITSLSLEPSDSGCFATMISSDTFGLISERRWNWFDSRDKKYEISWTVQLIDDKLSLESHNQQYTGPLNKSLVATLESGSRFQVTSSGFYNAD